MDSASLARPGSPSYPHSSPSRRSSSARSPWAARGTDHRLLLRPSPHRPPDRVHAHRGRRGHRRCERYPSQRALRRLDRCSAGIRDGRPQHHCATDRRPGPDHNGPDPDAHWSGCGFPPRRWHRQGIGPPPVRHRGSCSPAPSLARHAEDEHRAAAESRSPDRTDCRYVIRSCDTP
jgi:hypothetical protein